MYSDKSLKWFAGLVAAGGIFLYPFSLVGCTVSPGFDFQDFELGNKKDLIKQFPSYKDLIERFT